MSTLRWASARGTVHLLRCGAGEELTPPPRTPPGWNGGNHATAALHRAAQRRPPAHRYLPPYSSAGERLGRRSAAQRRSRACTSTTPRCLTVAPPGLLAAHSLLRPTGTGPGGGTALQWRLESALGVQTGSESGVQISGNARRAKAAAHTTKAAALLYLVFGAKQGCAFV
jgi:hypothetical protein